MSAKGRGVLAVRLALISAFVLTGILFLVSRNTRTHAQNQAQKHVRVPLVTDWSHRNMIYSRPSSMAQALRLQEQPRYLQQMARRNPGALKGQN
jgi:hypothetical protein